MSGAYAGSGNTLHGRRHTAVMSGGPSLRAASPGPSGPPAGSGHRSRPSNLITADTLGGWAEADVAAQASQMQAALAGLAAAQTAERQHGARLREQASFRRNISICDTQRVWRE